MSMLTKAASRFDAAFAAQPEEVRRAVALAIYRAFPAIQQYQKDLQPLTDDERVIDATWDLMIAVAFQVFKRGRDAFGDKFVAEMKSSAPHTFEFLFAVAKMIDGLIPGGTGAVGALPELPKLLGPMPDGEGVK